MTRSATSPTPTSSASRSTARCATCCSTAHDAARRALEAAADAFEANASEYAQTGAFSADEQAALAAHARRRRIDLDAPQPGDDDYIPF